MYLVQTKNGMSMAHIWTIEGITSPDGSMLR